MYWGFLVWMILGIISVVVMMYGYYYKDMLLKFWIFLYFIFGEKLRKSLFGMIIDVVVIIVVVVGIIGLIGFLGL